MCACCVQLSLTGLKDFVENDSHAVAEIRDIDNKELILLVGKDKVETLAAADTVGRLMLQCARQPGLGAVMEALLGFEGCKSPLSALPSAAAPLHTPTRTHTSADT